MDCSDYYVLIIGKRYGSLIEDGEFAGISYTHREFEYALSKGIPVLAFIKADKANFAGNSFETDAEKIQKLIDFTEEVKTGRVVKWFMTPSELSMQVVAALDKAFQKNNRPGWVRGDKNNLEEHDNSDCIDDYDTEIETYEFQNDQTPTDGQHRKINL